MARDEVDPAREPVHVSSIFDDFFKNAPCDTAMDSLGSITAADEEAVA